MQNELVKHMVNRFLSWRLPENFSPDDGIIFNPIANAGTVHEYRHEPIGTNLFNATQAEAMVRHMLDGFPMQNEDHALREALDFGGTYDASLNLQGALDDLRGRFDPKDGGVIARTIERVIEQLEAVRAVLSATPTQRTVDNGTSVKMTSGFMAPVIPAPIDNEALVEEVKQAILAQGCGDDYTVGDAARAVLALPSIATRARSAPVQSALVEEAIGALEWYAEQFCEYGSSDDGCGKYGDDICSGCKARATLAKLKEGRA